MDLFAILLFLHVLGAIVAFGPGFASMIVGPMVAKEPQYANFYARTQAATGRKLVTPLSISLAITGIGMIVVRGWSNLVSGKHWLEAAILLYVVAIVLAMAVMAPAGRRLVELTATPPAPGAGPSDELRKVAGRVRVGGMALSALVVVITLLMVLKPF
ncbi:MAG TPA: DUF2269 family protein [Candidatus Limnocylindrales bacterium]|nr:DUF2269 family protein [Candidatus Limnocylindrales bacterium]